MEAGERIKEIIRYKGLNVKTFAELVGYERPQALYDLIKGKTRNISPNMCEKVVEAVPEISRSWLMTGEGSMVQDQELAAPVEGKRVPLIPISAIAGPLAAYYESGVNLSWCPTILSPNPNADFAITITGDSMEPTFNDGATVFIKRINEAAFIPWGHPLVLDTENGVYIKNVLPDEANEQYIWASSNNPKYPPMHVPKTSINGIYRVLSVTKTFTTM